MKRRKKKRTQVGRAKASIETDEIPQNLPVANRPVSDINYDEVKAWLFSCAEDALAELALGLSRARCMRIRHPMTWTEVIDGEDVLFEVFIFDAQPASLHIGVSATLMSWRGEMLGTQGWSSSADYLCESP